MRHEENKRGGLKHMRSKSWSFEGAWKVWVPVRTRAKCRSKTQREKKRDLRAPFGPALRNPEPFWFSYPNPVFSKEPGFFL